MKYFQLKKLPISEKGLQGERLFYMKFKTHLVLPLLRLTYPSKAVVQIVKNCENFVKYENKELNFKKIIYYFTKDTSNVKIFESDVADEHDPQHLYILLLSIVKLYFNIRCMNLAKTNVVSERNYFKKIVLFKNK